MTGNKKISILTDFFAFERRNDLISETIVGKSKTWSIWPYLRVYYAESITLKRQAGVGVKRGMIGGLVKNIFYGNILNTFRRTRYLAFTVADQRKEIEGQLVHPIDLLPASITMDLLMVELPWNRKGQANKSPSRNILSAYLVVLVEMIVAILFARNEMKHLFLYHKLEKQIGGSVNKKYQARRFFGGYFVTRFLLKYWHRPDMVFCCAPYPFMGRILAFKEAGVPIVEIQHGYVGENHRAYYVPQDYGRQYYPDYFLSWGQIEKQFFSKKDNYYLPDGSRVYPVGNFYIDYLLSLTQVRKKEIARKNIPSGDCLIAVALQDPLEEDMLPFILACADLDPSIHYLLLPRTMPHKYYRETYSLPGNVFLSEAINTYEGIIVGDFHATIWSTTAIEAVMFGKTNILINPEGMAQRVMGATLNENNQTYYADNPSDYVNWVNYLRSNLIEQQDSSEVFHRKGVSANLHEAMVNIFSRENLTN